MQKITEIKESYTQKRVQLIDGKEVVTEEELSRFYEIPYVSGWARFGHYLLDNIFFSIFAFTIYFMLGFILKLTGHIYLLDEYGIIEYDYVYQWVILSPLFYFIFEFAMQATPGKAILKRVVVDEYGNKPGLKHIVIRSVSRIFPLNPLTCFGKIGCHDEWSKTFILRKKDLAHIRLLQKINNINATSVSLPEQL